VSSGTLSYKWYFGDGDSSNQENPYHIYAQSGTYQVQLFAFSNYGISGMTQATITVYGKPTAQFSFANVCEGSPHAFQDVSVLPTGTAAYEWNFGDGSAIQTGNSPSHQYTTTGVYHVNMKVTVNGCWNEVAHFVTYAPRAVPDFSTVAASC